MTLMAERNRPVEPDSRWPRFVEALPKRVVGIGDGSMAINRLFDGPSELVGMSGELRSPLIGVDRQQTMRRANE
jgi:hypothetical protein